MHCINWNQFPWDKVVHIINSNTINHIVINYKYDKPIPFDSKNIE